MDSGYESQVYVCWNCGQTASEEFIGVCREEGYEKLYCLSCHSREIHLKDCVGAVIDDSGE